ncbi:RNA polymerase sigma factor [Streptomyces sp. 900105755]
MREEDCALRAEFTEFVKETRNGLYWRAYRMCKNHAQADDLVQSGYLKLWKHWVSYRSSAPELRRALAYRTVTNVYIDFLRVKSNQPPRDIDDYDVADEEAIDLDLIARENAREVLQAVDQLPEPLREVIHAVYFDESTVAAFAESRGISPKLASRYHNKARKLLREILERR